VVIVEDVQRCRETVQVLIKDHPLALDCEGDLSSRKGGLSLVQIATKSGRCFIFDVQKGGGDRLFVEGGLRHVLEDVSMLKVGHDLRADARALLQQHSIFLNHIFDTQGAPLPTCRNVVRS
jgi:ribonuclease D